MKYNIHYRWVPAYLEWESKMITGRNIFGNIVVVIMMFFDRRTARKMQKEGKDFTNPITVDEVQE